MGRKVGAGKQCKWICLRVVSDCPRGSGMCRSRWESYISNRIGRDEKESMKEGHKEGKEEKEEMEERKRGREKDGRKEARRGEREERERQRRQRLSYADRAPSSCSRRLKKAMEIE